jgi:hypothetical protein
MQADSFDLISAVVMPSEIQAAREVVERARLDFKGGKSL